MRTIINVAIVLLIGLALGGLSANFALQKTHGIGAVNTGPWSRIRMEENLIENVVMK